MPASVVSATLQDTLWSLNWTLMAAGLINRLQVFPVISGWTGTSPILGGAADFDLELLETIPVTRRPSCSGSRVP
jgi:hypothetical protein